MADLKQLNGSKIPIAFQLGDKLIDGAVIKPIMFTTFADCVTEALNMKEPKTMEARLRRLRMVKQVTYYTNGSVAPVSMLDVLKMPVAAARTINAGIDTSEEKTAGKVIRTGDGVEQAITYELGTPIKVQGKEPIRELEFLAKTYGDIEDVLAAGDGIHQAVALISTVAKPLGTSLTLLPSWALAQISVTDGFTILSEVLPHFLGPVEESETP